MRFHLQLRSYQQLMVTERGEISEEDIKVEETHMLIGMSGGHGKEDWMDMCVSIYMFIYVKYVCIYLSNPLSNIYIYLTYINIYLTHIIYTYKTQYIFIKCMCAYVHYFSFAAVKHRDQKQLIEGSVYLGLQPHRGKSPPSQGSMAASGRHGSMRVESLHLQTQAESRAWKWHEAFTIKATPCQ